jgi:hypothetical protein
VMATMGARAPAKRGVELRMVNASLSNMSVSPCGREAEERGQVRTECSGNVTHEAFPEWSNAKGTRGGGKAPRDRPCGSGATAPAS